MAATPEIATQEVVRTDIQMFAGGTTWVDQAYDERMGDALRNHEPPWLDFDHDTIYANGRAQWTDIQVEREAPALGPVVPSEIIELPTQPDPKWGRERKAAWQAIHSRWRSGVPSNMKTATVEKLIRPQLKQMNITVSRETISRVLRRRK